ncbi:MAG: glycerophosphodiester phosphodiesterase, partial [Planctomycetes bacterium]|nr:glycerophosphodiester phosphodiesterase [Planctomycetota bacterium]
GIAALGVSVSLGFLITFLEEAGLMSIASTTYSGEPVSAVGALRQAFGRGRDLVGLALVTFVLGFVSFLPFAAAVGTAYSAWLTEYDINYYLAERPPAFWRAVAVAGVALVGLVLTWGWLYVRLMFALPACILANQRPVAGLKTSLRLTQGSVLRMTAVLLTWLLLIAIFSGLVGAVVQVVEYVGIKAAGERLGVLIPTLAGLVTLNLVTAAVISFVTVTTNALVIVRLYHDAAAGEADLRPQPAGVPPVPARLPHWLTTKRLLVGAALLFLGATVAITYFLVEQIGIDDEVAITAHRAGCRSAPENTTSALEASIREGADFAEIDVQETADGVIVVLHDADLMRTAGLRKNIWNIEYDELKSLDAGSWFSPEFRDQRIPTLQQMIDVARGRIRLNVELKFNGHDEKLVERVVRILAENDFQSECVVSSLDYEALVEAKALDERLEIGHIVSVAIGNVTKLDVDFLSVNQENVTSRYVQSIHGADKQVHVWTVNDRKRMSSLVDLGVDNIITDDPATLRAVLDERAEMINAERILLGFRNWLAR